MVWSASEPSIPVPAYGGFPSFICEGFPKWQNRLALVDGPTGKGYTYTKLNDIIKTVAGNLYHKAGVRKGDVILLCLPNSACHAVLMMAIPSIGGIISGCNPLYTHSEVLRQLHDANAVYLITTSDKQTMIPGLLKERPQIRSVFIIGDDVNRAYIPIYDFFVPGNPAPEIPINNRQDIAILPYSSGTTGLPKGVMITHNNVISAIQSIGPQGAQMTDAGKEVWITVFPLFHIGGAVDTIFLGLFTGTTIVFYPSFDFETFLAANQKYKATTIIAPPPIFVLLAKHPIVDMYDLSSLKKCIMGGATTSKETQEEVCRRIPSMSANLQTYGMTEATGGTHVTREHDIRLGSVGQVVPNAQFKIVDITTGVELPNGKSGEVCFRGDMLMKGYLNHPDATANTIKNGWLHSGDIGYTDEDGHLYIIDRLKELIKYKGFQVPPAELESLILKHPDIAEAAVIGLPDNEAGELPCAFVILKDGRKTTEKDIQDFVKSYAAPYKQLRGGVEFVNEIPKSPSGKILRRVLRDRVQAQGLKSKI